jgi:ISXO2-like transposase domain
MKTIFEVVALSNNKEALIQYLREVGILKREVRCNQCQCTLKTVKDKGCIDGYFMNCYACKKKQSIHAGTFLTNSKLSLKELMLFFYCWTLKLSVEQTATMLGISEHTIIDWNNLTREVCSLRFANETNPQLGEIGRVVQIDESVIYRPKYNRGHAVSEPTKWIFAMYDVDKKVGAIEFVQNRSAETLLPIIKKYVIPGTEIHSDQWSAYAGISSIDVTPGFIHKTVNHSLHFKDPSTGVHTNNVEAYWSSIKRRFKMLNGTSRSLTASYLDEHMYRERLGKTYDEMFQSMMQDIGRYGF